MKLTKQEILMNKIYELHLILGFRTDTKCLKELSEDEIISIDSEIYRLRQIISRIEETTKTERLESVNFVNMTIESSMNYD